MSFDGSVEQGGIMPGGEPAPFREVIRARVWMCPGRVRVDALRPGNDLPVVTYVDDGSRVRQWSGTEFAEEPSTTHDRDLGRDVYVGRAEIDGCLFGAWLNTWLGDCTPYPDLFLKQIGAGRYIGIANVENHPCHAVVCDFPPRELPGGESLLVRKAFYIDVGTKLLRRRKTSQVLLDRSGRIRQDITRIETLRNLRTEPFAGDVFDIQPPAGCTKMELSGKQRDVAPQQPRTDLP